MGLYQMPSGSRPQISQDTKTRGVGVHGRFQPGSGSGSSKELGLEETIAFTVQWAGSIQEQGIPTRFLWS